MEKKELIVLSAEDILNSKIELDQAKVEISGGRAVYVREMTGAEKTEWEITGMKEVPTVGKQQAGMKINFDDYRTKLAVFTLCNPEGNRLFGNEFLMPRRLKELGAKFKASDLEAICDKASEINKIRPEDIEALAKNSGADVKGSSTSASA